VSGVTGAAPGGGAGARSQCEFERESIDQDIELFSLEIIIAAGPIEHEKRSPNRAVEVDRPGTSLSGNAGDEQETGGEFPETADEGSVGGRARKAFSASQQDEVGLMPVRDIDG
jgi:hypothetical protein